MVSLVETVDLETTARRLVARGKGILAADESLSTMKKRFDGVGLESTEDLRRAYRQMLFTTADFERFISGVILFEESTSHMTDDGESFVDLLASKGILPGVKVGTGNKEIPGYPGEMYTEGLDGLQEALPAMRDRGIAFTKWRAVIGVGEGRPSQFAIDTNAQSLARMAALSQQAGLVPIVEPEVLMEGTHGIDECRQATERTLRALFAALAQHRVRLEGLLLKTNMVLPGKESGITCPPSEVAEATIACFRDVLPPALPGVVFLSGGQSEDEATVNLNAMNTGGDLPWELTFSYGRALLDSALKTWAGSNENAAAAQERFLTRARNNADAREGRYAPQTAV
jgi:fructose-bisphosphate aldolase, class I